MSANPLDRYRRALRQFIKFGLIGAAGVAVNMATVTLADNIGRHFFGVHNGDPFLPLPGTDRAIRYYIVYAGIAFLVANEGVEQVELTAPCSGPCSCCATQARRSTSARRSSPTTARSTPRGCSGRS